MKFFVSKDFFDKVSDAYFGIVIVKDFDNTKSYDYIEREFNRNLEDCKSKFLGIKVKENDLIIPYRDAFLKLGINPNKYMCSIEALMTRISKGHEIPRINSIVDLCNSLSLKYILPIGAHDVDNFKGDIEIRKAKEGDTFVPFGSEEVEHLDSEEFVYASGSEVKTRRWTWRQGEKSKLTENSKYLFIPIDGFTSNKDKVEALKEELINFLKGEGLEVVSGHVDKNSPVFEWK